MIFKSKHTTCTALEHIYFPDIFLRNSGSNFTYPKYKSNAVKSIFYVYKLQNSRHNRSCSCILLNINTIIFHTKIIHVNKVI